MRKSTTILAAVLCLTGLASAQCPAGRDEIELRHRYVDGAGNREDAPGWSRCGMNRARKTRSPSA